MSRRAPFAAPGAMGLVDRVLIFLQGAPFPGAFDAKDKARPSPSKYSPASIISGVLPALASIGAG